MEQESSVSVASALSQAPEAKVAVLDIFSKQPEGELWHGDLVSSILVNQGVDESKILKLDNSNDHNTNALLSDLGWKTGPEPTAERVDAYIELSAVHLLMKTNGKLKSLLDTPGHNIKVINQSQGKSRVDIYELLADNIFDVNNVGPNGQRVPSTLGKNLSQALGVDSTSPDGWGRALKQKIIERVDSVVDNSTLVAEVRGLHEGLLEKLGERGVTVVTSAGNNADELAELRDDGFQVPNDFDDDITAVGPKLIVGAIDRGPTPSSSDDTVAFFSSQYDGVNAYADGVNVATAIGFSTGTSFAAPLVAASAYRFSEDHPNLTSDATQQALFAEFPRPGI